MPTDIIQSATWPGVIGVQSAQYVCSHGISPGRAILTTYPQLAAPAAFGDLTFSDGRRKVVIPNCKVDSVSPQWSANGTVYTLEILDERWQWTEKGSVVGRYNRLDDTRKLIPWTIRSPQEMAAQCLYAMGVRSFVVDLPRGLPRAAGANIDRYLKAGENFAMSLANPAVVWDHTAPALALAQLAEEFGARVIYQPVARRVIVTTPGKGKPFPSLAYESIGANIDSPESPVAVGVFGQPIKYQLRFLLQAVGEEWDGRFVPINELSYAPKAAGADRPQVSNIRFVGGLTSEPLEVFLSFQDPKTGKAESFEASSSDPAFTVTQRLDDIKDKLSAEPAVAANFKLETALPILTFTGKSPFSFTLTATNPANANQVWTVETTAHRINPDMGSWESCPVPSFPTVQATDRLSYSEARALAQKTVFRCYRILVRDPSDTAVWRFPGKPLVLPFAGKILRRQQIVLLDTKVEQVIPSPRIPGAVNVPNQAANDVPGQGVLPEFYNGYSRAQAATVTGSVYTGVTNVLWAFDRLAKFNTLPTDRVFVPFSVNQAEQMIVFSEPVFEFAGAAGTSALQAEPVLTLETGCHVLSAETDQPFRWEEVLPIPGGVAPVEWHFREDIDVGIVFKYTPKNKFITNNYFDAADTKARAGHYLRGLAARYKVVGGETRQYVGIIPHDPDGYCQQVSWSVGEGATTVVSGNTEFHPAIPSYPARRRAENLPPDRAAAAANAQEFRILAPLLPQNAKRPG